MIKVLLVDDHKIIRDGIKSLLSESDNINIAGECSDGCEVELFLKTNEIHVVLLDINMPKMNGIETTEMIVKTFPNTRVLILSMNTQDSYITKALQAGASGYILKTIGKEDLVNAIETVFKGDNYFGKDVSEIMMAKFMKKSIPHQTNATLLNVDDLTKREIEVLKLIARELTNQEISDKLFISPRTVDSHRRNLLQKIGAKNTAGLVGFAYQNGLLD
jgi:DNA-binding NarL/FixJ family response regulator